MTIRAEQAAENLHTARLRPPDRDLGPIMMLRFRFGAPIGAELPQ